MTNFGKREKSEQNKRARRVYRKSKRNEAKLKHEEKDRVPQERFQKVGE